MTPVFEEVFDRYARNLKMRLGETPVERNREIAVGALPPDGEYVVVHDGDAAEEPEFLSTIAIWPVQIDVEGFVRGDTDQMTHHRQDLLARVLQATGEDLRLGGLVLDILPSAPKYETYQNGGAFLLVLKTQVRTLLYDPNTVAA